MSEPHSSWWRFTWPEWCLVAWLAGVAVFVVRAWLAA